MRSRLEKITKSKVIKKTKQLTSKFFMYSRAEKNQYQDLLQIFHLILEHVSTTRKYPKKFIKEDFFLK